MPFTQAEVGKEDAHDRRVYNGTLSWDRIDCEHTIGYLKGRMQSLKELRLEIKTEDDIKFAMLWIRTCDVLHMYAFNREHNLDLSKERWCKDGMAWERKQVKWQRKNLQREQDAEGAAAAKRRRTKAGKRRDEVVKEMMDALEP